jgi:hypothetical protein
MHECREALAWTKLASTWIWLPATSPASTHCCTTRPKSDRNTSRPRRFRALLNTHDRGSRRLARTGRRESRAPRNLNPNARRYSLRPSSGRLFGGGSTGSTSGAGRIITRILPRSAMESVGPLKSLTRIDRSSRVATTAFRAGMEERSPLPTMGRTIPSRNSVGRSLA